MYLCTGWCNQWCKRGVRWCKEIPGNFRFCSLAFGLALTRGTSRAGPAGIAGKRGVYKGVRLRRITDTTTNCSPLTNQEKERSPLSVFFEFPLKIYILVSCFPKEPPFPMERFKWYFQWRVSVSRTVPDVHQRTPYVFPMVIVTLK